MKSRLILNAVLLLALVGLGLYAYVKPGEKTEPALKISQLDRDSISTIRVERTGKPTIELEKRADAWYMLAPFKTRADPFQVDRLLDITQGVAKQKLPRENLQRFNLDPAALTVTLNDQRFAFGSINDVTNEQYLATADTVYLVAPFLGYGVSSDAAKFFSHKLLSPHETPTAFDFGAWKLVKNEHGQWKTEGTPPKSDIALSADDLNQWAAEWQLASSLATQPFTGGSVRERLKVTLKDGRTLDIEVLARKPEVILVRGDENMSYQFGTDAGARLLDPFVVARSR